MIRAIREFPCPYTQISELTGPTLDKVVVLLSVREWITVSHVRCFVDPQGYGEVMVLAQIIQQQLRGN